MEAENKGKSFWSKWKKPIATAVLGGAFLLGGESAHEAAQAKPKEFRPFATHELQDRAATFGGEYISGRTSLKETSSEAESRVFETILSYDPYTGEAFLMYDDGNPDEGPKLISTYLDDLLNPENRELLPDDTQIDSVLEDLRGALPEIEAATRENQSNQQPLDDLEKN